MKNLAISIGVLWIMSLAGTGGAKAWSCSGDACLDVLFKFDGCYITEIKDRKR
jgi:hypothetical protein